MKKNSKKGFTVLELAVVIAIFGLLASIVLIAVRGAKEKSKYAAVLQFSGSIKHSLGSNIVAEYKFEDNVSDSSGNGNNGINYNVTFTPNGVSPQLGKAGSFNGANSHVNCGNGASLNITDAITIETWIKPNNVGAAYLRIIHKGDPSGALRGYGIVQSMNSKLVGFYQKNYMTVEFGRRTSIALENSRWYHIVMTWNGTENDSGVLMYVNGVDVSESREGPDMSFTSYAAEMNIGRRAGSSSGYFNGFIDEVRIYSQALTAFQIQRLYAEGAAKRGIVAK